MAGRAVRCCCVACTYGTLYVQDRLRQAAKLPAAAAEHTHREAGQLQQPDLFSGSNVIAIAVRPDVTALVIANHRHIPRGGRPAVASRVQKPPGWVGGLGGGCRRGEEGGVGVGTGAGVNKGSVERRGVHLNREAKKACSGDERHVRGGAHAWAEGMTGGRVVLGPPLHAFAPTQRRRHHQGGLAGSTTARSVPAPPPAAAATARAAAPRRRAFKIPKPPSIQPQLLEFAHLGEERVIAPRATPRATPRPRGRPRLRLRLRPRRMPLETRGQALHVAIDCA